MGDKTDNGTGRMAIFWGKKCLLEESRTCLLFSFPEQNKNRLDACTIRFSFICNPAQSTVITLPWYIIVHSNIMTTHTQSHSSMQAIKMMKSQHATKDINQRWHIPAAATMRSRTPSVVRSALLSKTWHPFVIIDHNLPRERQDSLTIFCMLLHMHFPFIFYNIYPGVFCICAREFLFIYLKQWDYIKLAFMSNNFLFGIFFWDIHCSLGHQTSTTNEKQRKKEMDACADMHQQTCWQACHCGCHMTGRNSCFAYASAAHLATAAVTFTVTFRAKAIYFNDIDPPRLQAAWTAWHFEARLNRRSHQSRVERAKENESSLEGAVDGVPCSVIRCQNFGLHVKTAMLKIKLIISKSSIQTAGRGHPAVLLYAVHTHGCSEELQLCSEGGILMCDSLI